MEAQARRNRGSLVTGRGRVTLRAAFLGRVPALEERSLDECAVELRRKFDATFIEPLPQSVEPIRGQPPPGRTGAAFVRRDQWVVE